MGFALARVVSAVGMVYGSFPLADDAVRTACLVIGIAAALGVAVLIVLSLKTHVDVLKEHHG